jgi:NADPH-dependent 2,4-dienoyl-CoA reductase/sulfur reductase-like enzyme
MAKASEPAVNRDRRKTEPDEKALREMVEKKAYEIYQKRGRGHGKNLDDWLEAEKIVMGKKGKNKEAVPLDLGRDSSDFQLYGLNKRRRFNEVNRMPYENHFDVVIIGTGAGGGTLAHALASSGKRILLLERSDYVPREKDNWAPRAVNVEGKYQTKEVWQD